MWKKKPILDGISSYSLLSLAVVFLLFFLIAFYDHNKLIRAYYQIDVWIPHLKLGYEYQVYVVVKEKWKKRREVALQQYIWKKGS